jgi:hypothetical protein
MLDSCCSFAPGRRSERVPDQRRPHSGGIGAVGLTSVIESVPAPVRVKLKRAERLPRPARRKHRNVTVLPRMAGAPAQQEINEPTN